MFPSGSSARGSPGTHQTDDRESQCAAARDNPTCNPGTPHTDQVRHDVGQPVVVIPLNPHHFDVSLGIRQLPDVPEKLPMFFGQPGKIEVGKNVAQQDQPLKPVFFKHAGRLARAARLRTQVQVREDQRVIHVQIHASVLPAECYGLINIASILVHQ